jgi:hypothetical protein
VGAANRIARRLRQRRGLDGADQSSGLFQPGPASTDAPLIGGLVLGQRLTAPLSPVIVCTSVRCPICKSNSAMRDKRKAFEAILEKFEKILPHLGNENDGEALNALRSLTALLKKAGLDWHDLVTLLHGGCKGKGVDRYHQINLSTKAHNRPRVSTGAPSRTPLAERLWS